MKSEVESEGVHYLTQFGELIARHPDRSFLDDDAVRESLTLWAQPLGRGKLLECIYAPFEHIETTADLVIVGITPGATQAENALSAARTALRRRADIVTAAREAKIAASFSGAMRSNLCARLDHAGAARWLGIGASRDLFSAQAHRVHFTSALCYPVFVDRNNYNGSPDVLATDVLRKTVEESLAAEVRALPHAMWLPLWDVPAAALNCLARRGILAEERILPPMPHPSGGNGENIAWFLGRNRKSTFSSRRASTGQVLLDRRDRLRAFFGAGPQADLPATP